MRRIAFLAALAVASLVFDGCVKVREGLVLMPDGSGKLTVSFCLSPELASFGGEESDPLDDFMETDPDEFTADIPGIVAVTKPERIEEGGWKGIRFTMYFEDINKVKFLDDPAEDGTRKANRTFAFRKTEDGFTLEIEDTSLAEEEEEEEIEDEEFKKEMEKMFKSMMKGFELRNTVTMPGDVTSIKTFTSKEGRKASLRISEGDIERQKDFKKYSSFKAVCGPSKVSDAERDAFKKELAAAKVAWEKLKKEMKKRSEERKKREEEEKKKQEEEEGKD
ncbi:MAG: hypothetical protein ACYTAF_17380 [Planctomycetota bacterium]|jgi:hypothetical protein